MLVLGLLLIIAALAVGFGAIFDGTESAKVEIFGTDFDPNVAGVFVAGAVSMLVLLLGVLAVMNSMGRARRKRSDRKEAKSRQQASVQQLEDERAALRAENERLAERLSDRGTPMGSTAGGAAAGGSAMAAGSTDQDHGHEQPSGARGLMDKVTGRSGHDDNPTDNPTDNSTDDRVHDDNPTDDRVIASPTGSTGSTTQTDLTATEQTSSSGRHRDEI